MLSFFRNVFRVSGARHDLRYLWLGVCVGVVSAVFAILFREAIDHTARFFFGSAAHGQPFWQVIAQQPWYVLMILPTMGGIVVSVLTKAWAPEAAGHGVPEIMDAVTTRRGRIRPRVSLVKMFGSALSIGTGFSVGREGPTALIGAAVGSAFGQVLRFPVFKMKMVVGCGAAAGIAATFNTPLAGAAFALELVVGQFSVRYLTPIILAAMIATVVTHNYYGEFHALFSVTKYDLSHPYEIVGYALLGVVLGLAGACFTRLLYASEEGVERQTWPTWLKGAIGGIGMGAVLLVAPEMAGPSTWDAINLPLTTEGLEGVGHGEGSQRWALSSLIAGPGWLEIAGFFALLAVLKMFTTSWSLAWGASGGVFAPSLMMGGLLGAAYGHVAKALVPQYTDAPSGYALVGMGAFVAGVTQAPLTAIAMIFEMTNNMSIVLPLIVSSSIALGVFNHVMEGSIYTLKLKRRGLAIEWGRETGILQSTMVSEVAAREDKAVAPGASVAEIKRVFEQETSRSTLPVVADDGQLVGLVSYWDIVHRLGSEDFDPEQMSVEEMARRQVEFVTPGQNLYEAFTIISSGDFDYLPVLKDSESRQVVGRLSRHRLLQVYKKQLIGRGIIEDS